MTSPAWIGRAVSPFTARIASRSSVNTRAGPRWRNTPLASTNEGSIAVAFTTAPSGARLPVGNTMVLVIPARRALSGLMITSSADTLAAALGFRRDSPFACPQRALRRACRPGRRHHVAIEKSHTPEMQHHLGHSARHEHLNGRETARAVRQRVDQARRRQVDAMPVLDGRNRQSRGMRDRRNVQQQIRRPAERGMDEHGVLDRARR